MQYYLHLHRINTWIDHWRGFIIPDAYYNASCGIECCKSDGDFIFACTGYILKLRILVNQYLMQMKRGFLRKHDILTVIRG